MLSPARQPIGQAGVSFARAGRVDLRAEPVFLVENYFSTQVGKIEALSQIGYHHHREFQALALVDAHQANGTFSDGCLHLRIGARATLCVNQTQKPEQSLALEPIELPGQAEQTLDVGVALVAARLGEQPFSVMRFA